MSSGFDPPAGWYPDPETPGTNRYWDGQQWSLASTPAASGPPTSGGVWTAAGSGDAADETATRHTAVGALASPGQRLGAFILDLTLIFLAAFVLSLPTLLFDTLAPGSVFAEGVALLSGLVILAFLFAYPFVAEGKLGQTYGKHLLGIRVARIGTTDPIGIGPAIGRGLVRGIGVYALGLGVLWMLWDDAHQGWHDKAVGSHVVVEPSSKRDNPVEHIQRLLGGR